MLPKETIGSLTFNVQNIYDDVKDSQKTQKSKYVESEAFFPSNQKLIHYT